MYEKYSNQSLPTKEYRELLGTAICVFNSNNGFIIENMLNSNLKLDWYKLIDSESGNLKKFYDSLYNNNIDKNIVDEICELFSELINMRNRIIHSFRITNENGEQTLATKTKIKDGNKQFEITKDYLIEFIEKNNKCSSLLHKFRGY